MEDKFKSIPPDAFQVGRVKAMGKFLYFIANFPRNFIEKCWEDDSLLREHLTEKFLGINKNETYVTLGNMLKFMFELNNGNQMKLFKWIDENYNP
jgi:hypothetical protein